MTGDQRRLAVGLFVVAWGTNVSTPLILVYQDRLALSNSAAVAIFSVYVGGIALALLFAGRLSDRFGRRSISLGSLAASGLGSLILIGGQDSLAVLLVGRFILGMVSGAMLSVGTAWLNELASTSAVDRLQPAASAVPTATADRLKLALVTTVVIYIGFGFGPVTSAVYERFGESPLVVPYLLHAVACGLALTGTWRLRETKLPDPNVSLRPRLGIPPSARREFARVLAPASVWVFGFPSISFALFPLILRDAIGDEYDVLLSGANGTVTAMAVLLSRPLTNLVGDARRAIPVALAIGVMGYVIGIVAFTTDVWPLVPVGAIALGTASGVLMGSGLAITEEIADDTNRGALSSTFYLAAYSGMTMPLIVTGLAAFTSTTMALMFVTATALLATVSVSFAVRGASRSQSRATA